MKKVWMAAALIAVLSTAVSGYASAATEPFKDIANVPAQEKIEALHNKGIIHGATNSEFEPAAKLTSAQGVALIVRTFELSLAAIDFIKAPEAKDIYTKVKDGEWYSDPFIIAHYNGIELPRDIDPEQPLTKEQFVHFLVQGLEKTGNYPLIKMYINIKDEKAIDVAYQGTIQRALLYKLTALDANGYFNPKEIVNRADAAGMLYDAMKFVESHKEKASTDQPSEK